MKNTLAGLVLALSVAAVAGAAPAPLSTYMLDAPCRFLDTRDAITFWYEPEGPFTYSAPRLYLLQGSCGVPLGAAGALLTFTVTGATKPGHLIAWNAQMITDPTSGTIPKTSVANFTPGVTLANSTTVALGAVPSADGSSPDLALAAFIPGGSVHVIIDVVGYLK
jgi:hypothetical protein